ncbi:MopE-related protein [Nanoarchaeota archaeon]
MKRFFGVKLIFVLFLVSFMLMSCDPRNQLVTIESDPSDAIVWVDDMPLMETTPVTVELPQGRHEIVIEKKNYTTKYLSLDVSTVPIVESVVLGQYVTFESEPEGASVWIADLGNFMGVTPLTIVLPEGSTTVSLSLEGYEPHWLTVEVSNSALEKNVVLKKPCVDNDGDGYGIYQGGDCPNGPERDCGDWDSQIYPGSVEICEDEFDNDCNGMIDEGCICNWFVDKDRDGYAREGDEYCPGGPEKDCDDNSPAINPGALEYCGDYRDNDCDGYMDEQDCVEPNCEDLDHDGYGNPGDISCRVGIKTDCDDRTNMINPGRKEKCGDGRDNDCDGFIDVMCHCFDEDGDRWGQYGGDSCLNWGEDCWDWDSHFNPGASEICGDEVDNDCDGEIDEGCPCNLNVDSDRDGYGNPGDSECPNGGETDCNDEDDRIYPGAPEACGLDFNCDGNFQTCPEIQNIAANISQKFPLCLDAPFSIVPFGDQGRLYISCAWTYMCPIAPDFLTNPNALDPNSCTFSTGGDVFVDEYGNHCVWPIDYTLENSWICPNEDIEGNSPEGYYKRNYQGITSVEHVWRDGKLKVITINHGENKNTWENNQTFCVQNTVDTIRLCNDCVISDEHECTYNGFVTMNWVEAADVNGWGATGFNEVGPIIWPSAGYGRPNEPETRRGAINPTSIIINDSLYVFYIDYSDGPFWEGKGSGLKVARAWINESGIPQEFHSYKGGTWDQTSLPENFNIDNPDFLTEGPQSFTFARYPYLSSWDYTGEDDQYSVVFLEPRSFGFSTAKIRGTNYYLGVDQVKVYSDQVWGTVISLSIWEDFPYPRRGKIIAVPNTFRPGDDLNYYTKAVNKELTSDKEIDLSDFYIMSICDVETNDRKLCYIPVQLDLSIFGI